MEIKKNSRYVCVENVDNIFTKGNVYNVAGTGEHIISEYGSYSPTAHGDYEKYFIPCSKLDRVYTKYTEKLYKMYIKHHGIIGGEELARYCEDLCFDNMEPSGETGTFGWAYDDSFAKKQEATYLSEQAFIEFMDLEVEQVDKFAELKASLSKGQIVQFRCAGTLYSWVDCGKDHEFQPDFEYRIKPEEDGLDRVLAYPATPEESYKELDAINPQHYNQYSIQPLDYIEANGFDFCEGNLIKYVSRYKQKNGLEDLKKAQVYLQKLIDRYEK